MSILLPTNVNLRSEFRALSWLPHLSAPSRLWVGKRVCVSLDESNSALVDTLRMLADQEKPDGRRHVLVIHEGAQVDASLVENVCRLSRGAITSVWLGSSRVLLPAQYSSQIVDLGIDQSSIALGRRDPLLLKTEVASPRRIETLAQDLACLVDESSGSSGQAIPQLVPLGNLLPRPLPDETRTASSAESLIVSLGETDAGRFDLDVLDQGPHLLVVGTTGSGKSELLRSLVSSVLARYSSNDCVQILIDFKGGASMKEFAAAPQVVGMVSNLTGHDVDRLIRFLRRENLRRQELLSDYNGSYVEYRKTNMGLPRLLVVIDEYQGFVDQKEAKAEQAMLEIAARGRALGIHLVISTQSPRSVVSGGVLANVNARISLRVLNEPFSVADRR